MQSWEYAVLCWDEGKRWSCPTVPNLEINPTDEDWQIASRLGAQGWEMVGIEGDGGLWFKRPSGPLQGDPSAT